MFLHVAVPMKTGIVILLDSCWASSVCVCVLKCLMTKKETVPGHTWVNYGCQKNFGITTNRKAANWMVRLQLNAIVEPLTIVILLWGEALRLRGFPRKFPSLVAGSKKYSRPPNFFFYQRLKHICVAKNYFWSYWFIILWSGFFSWSLTPYQERAKTQSSKTTWRT